ncbi:hypothetical protein DFJ43DRAFT_1041806 [Lentinula guzmanii]|uniref:Uncharacterized protein n=1 Tax=Lentinula guzmanii TaxID=2804957 RepID=A0AA38MWZ5_9AGAR|nr:hypothetical protein DFJ43DRAFT_1041806 [Lentinula guzmanii]
MPRKHALSAILKSQQSAAEKAAAKAKSRQITNRRYRRKLLYKEPERDRERKANERAAMSSAEKANAQERKKEENANYYLNHREDILDKKMRQRTQSYIAKYGEYSFFDRYPHKSIKYRKYLPEPSE